MRGRKRKISDVWKKDELDCNNVHGLGLLCRCSKILATVILRRIRIGFRKQSILTEQQLAQ